MIDTRTAPHLIGLSLSFCIRDVIEGHVSVEQIDRLSTGTKCHVPEDWDHVIAEYREWYWQKDPDRAERIVRQLLALGLIDQPRVRGEKPIPIHSGHWRLP